ncbi:hypothetical protein BJX70DRAFT_21238 [Aspergillus crustosus]
MYVELVRTRSIHPHSPLICISISIFHPVGHLFPAVYNEAQIPYAFFHFFFPFRHRLFVHFILHFLFLVLLAFSFFSFKGLLLSVREYLYHVRLCLCLNCFWSPIAIDSIHIVSRVKRRLIGRSCNIQPGSLTSEINWLARSFV